MGRIASFIRALASGQKESEDYQRAEQWIQTELRESIIGSIWWALENSSAICSHFPPRHLDKVSWVTHIAEEICAELFLPGRVKRSDPRNAFERMRDYMDQEGRDGDDEECEALILGTRIKKDQPTDKKNRSSEYKPHFKSPIWRIVGNWSKKPKTREIPSNFADSKGKSTENDQVEDAESSKRSRDIPTPDTGESRPETELLVDELIASLTQQLIPEEKTLLDLARQKGKLNANLVREALGWPYPQAKNAVDEFKAQIKPIVVDLSDYERELFIRKLFEV